MATMVLPQPVKRHYSVSDKEFENILRGRFLNPIYVSEEEAEAMQGILGSTPIPIKAQHFRVGFDEKCSSCTKKLTFFDIFSVGIGVHGAQFLKAALFGPRKIIGKYEDGTEHHLPCSQCGHVNVIRCQDYYCMEFYSCG